MIRYVWGRMSGQWTELIGRTANTGALEETGEYGAYP
jgi:hypothetical protein